MRGLRVFPQQPLDTGRAGHVATTSRRLTMPASLDHIHSDTPMGANLIGNGATFRVWAPNARSVHVIGDFNNHQRDDESLLNRDELGHWRGFIPDVQDRDRYLFYVVGEGSEGPKRDPYARELQTPFPSECIAVRGRRLQPAALFRDRKGNWSGIG